MKLYFFSGLWFVALLLFRRLMVLNTMLRLRIWRLRGSLVADDQVAPYAHGGLAIAQRELEALGFTPIGWVRVERERGDTPDDEPRVYARMFHPTALAYAMVAFANAPEAAWPWSVAFTTHEANRRVVRTEDASDAWLLGHPPGMRVLSSSPGTMLEIWERHRVATADVIPVNIDHDAAFLIERDLALAHFDACVFDGRLAPGTDHAYLLSWPMALRASRLALASSKALPAQRTRRAQVRREQALPDYAVPVEAESGAYQRNADATSGPPRASFLAVLFGVTVVLFFGASWSSTHAAVTGAMVVGILFFHELGHYLAMRAFGYVDTTIFFVPYLGGFATGHKDRASIAERMFVLFAGPLPGLLVAGALAVGGFAANGTVRECVRLAAVINAFNLLPILPLDGGQVAYILLFARRPWLDIASRVVAIAGFLAMGLELDSSAPIFWVFAALLSIQLRSAWRTSTLRRKLWGARSASPGAAPARLVFEVIRETPLARLPYAQKVVFARTSLAQAWLAARLRVRDIVTWLAAYASVFMVGVAVLVAAYDPKYAGYEFAARKAPPPQIVADVPLPWPPGPAKVGTGKVLFLSRVGVGLFASPEALVAAQPAVVEALPGETVRALGPALFVWTQTPETKGDDDEVDEAAYEAAVNGAHERAVTALRGKGARFLEVPPTITIVECSTSSEAAAQAIVDRIVEHAVAQTSGAAFVPPWESANPPTPAESLARRTLYVAMEASRASRREDLAIEGLLLVPHAEAQGHSGDVSRPAARGGRACAGRRTSSRSYRRGRRSSRPRARRRGVGARDAAGRRSAARAPRPRRLERRSRVLHRERRADRPAGAGQLEPPAAHGD